MLNTAKAIQYILDEEGKPIPEPDPVKWAQFFIGGRVLRQDELPNGAYVSTIFLGVGPAPGEWGPPKLWETIIAGGPHDGYQERFSCREAALAGHERALALASDKLN